MIGPKLNSSASGLDGAGDAEQNFAADTLLSMIVPKLHSSRIRLDGARDANQEFAADTLLSNTTSTLEAESSGEHAYDMQVQDLAVQVLLNEREQEAVRIEHDALVGVADIGVADFGVADFGVADFGVHGW